MWTTVEHDKGLNVVRQRHRCFFLSLGKTGHVSSAGRTLGVFQAALSCSLFAAVEAVS
jgi:hypothetical protein